MKAPEPVVEPHMEVIPLAKLHCPECGRVGPTRLECEPGGLFVWVHCTSCLLDWKVSG